MAVPDEGRRAVGDRAPVLRHAPQRQRLGQDEADRAAGAPRHADRRLARRAGRPEQAADSARTSTSGPPGCAWRRRPSPVYRKNIRLHIAPALGTVPLAALTTERIDRLYRELERGGRADHRQGEGLSPRTVRYVHTILSAALGAAVKTRRLARNPAADASPPTAKQAKAPEMHPWNAAQLAAFLDWSREHSPNHAPWHVLAYTGMRRGELLALRWQDIDLDAATVSVRRSAGVIRNEGAAREISRRRHQDGKAADRRPRPGHRRRAARLEAERGADGAPAGPGRGARVRQPRRPVPRSGDVLPRVQGRAAAVRPGSATPRRRRSGCTTCGTRTPRSC